VANELCDHDMLAATGLCEHEWLHALILVSTGSQLSPGDGLVLSADSSTSGGFANLKANDLLQITDLRE
jgi:hypothetical protein